MSLEIPTDPNEVKDSPIPLPFPNPWWGRVLIGLFITVLPAFSFWAVQGLKPEWQSEKLSDYIILSLFPEASLLFFPLLAYSIICYLLLLFVPTRYSQSFFVRLGIYTGVLLALQYSIAVIICSTSPFLFFIFPLWIAPPIISRVYRWAINKWNARRVNAVLAILFVGTYLIFAILERQLLSPLFIILVALVIAAPCWSFLLALQATLWLIKNRETKFILPRGIGVFVWLSAYIAAWRFDILKMYELYAALPSVPPPDCYIATAAAQGHSRFVGSRRIKWTDGSWMWVNRQLQILKCAELALMGLSPRLHRFLRRAYDALGRPLARRIRNPWLADLAWLSLKPLEALARTGLRVVVPEIESISARIYV